MSILEYITNGRSRREGTGKPVPSEGFGRYYSLLGMHFWKLVGLNLLFIAFSIPVVTIPAALCGVNRVCVMLIREGNVFVWDEFIREFKSSFGRRILLGFLFAFFLFLGYYLFSLGLSNIQSIWGFLFNALGFFALLVVLSWGAYIFVLMPMLSLKNSAILKDAFLLLILKPGRALGVIGAQFIMAFIAFILFPISIFLLAFCWFSLTQYTVCFLVNTPVQEFIIAPYEAKLSKMEGNPS